MSFMNVPGMFSERPVLFLPTVPMYQEIKNLSSPASPSSGRSRATSSCATLVDRPLGAGWGGCSSAEKATPNGTARGSEWLGTAIPCRFIRQEFTAHLSFQLDRGGGLHNAAPALGELTHI